MSDALTDIGRDQRRNEISQRLHELEEKFKAGPTQELYDKMIGVAKEMDSVPRGYSGSPSQALKYIEKQYGSKLMNNAIFSTDRKYRYMLVRQWDATKLMVMFIGLNPSTANETENDPTVRRVIGFAKDWGYGGVYMMNLFAYVSTDPKALINSGEKIERNNVYLEAIAGNAEKVVFAWGAFKLHKKRMLEVMRMFPNAYCLGRSKDGYPKHPLYLKKDTKLIKANGN